MPRIDHDSTCRRLFGDPRMVRDLFVGFVDSELGQLLDWSTLKQVAARHTSEDLHQSENDMIWELQRLGGTGPPVYLMLEFQSQPDWTMALRMWNYCGQFCETLAKQEAVRKQRQLPTVLPIVVYDGEQEWREVQDVADLVGFVPSGWEEQSPRMAFVLVDVFRSAGLDRSLRNLVDAMFRLLRAGARDAPGEVRLLKQRLRGEEWASLRRDLMVWIIGVLLPWRQPGMSIRDLGDLDDLEAAMTTWSEQWKAEGLVQGRAEGRTEGRAEGRVEGRTEGRAEGRVEGRTEGRVEGRAAMLVSLARQRFGEAAASTMAALLESVTSEAAFDEIGRCLLTCPNGDDLLAQIRQV